MAGAAVWPRPRRLGAHRLLILVGHHLEPAIRMGARHRVVLILMLVRLELGLVQLMLPNAPTFMDSGLTRIRPDH